MATKPEKTADNSPEVGKLIPQPHGGALLHGNPGNKGGPGVPPSAIRRKLRGDFNRRRKVLRDIADSPKVAEKDRLKAIDIMGKYGLGTVKSLSDDEVRSKLTDTLQTIRAVLTQELGADGARVTDTLLDALHPIWSDA